MTVLLKGQGVHLVDEIVQSSRPRDHAFGIVDTLIRENMKWVAQQINPNDDRYREASHHLADACAARGFQIEHGTWAQHVDPPVEIQKVIEYRARFHLLNNESAHENAKWTGDNIRNLDALVALGLPHGLGLVFTEAAMDRDKAKSAPYRARDVVGMPEAIESENPQANPFAMEQLAGALGWTRETMSLCIYLTRGYPASEYREVIEGNFRLWSIWRYGDIDESDWVVLRTWPRPAAVPPPPDPDTGEVPINLATTRSRMLFDYNTWRKTVGTLTAGQQITKAVLAGRILKSTDAQLSSAELREIKALLDRKGAPPA